MRKKRAKRLDSVHKSTVDHLNGQQHNHSLGQLKSTRELTFWLAMLILISCNFLISIILIPFLIVAESAFVYIITSTIGLIIGCIFSFVIKDLEDIESHHHAIAMVFVPIIAILNIVIIVNLSYAFADKLSLYIQIIPWNLGIIYGVALLLPSLLSSVRSKLFKQS